ncbi:hypothetical protein COJ30_17785 [Bacillus anthracis]|uniref:Spermidine/putrescine ABC transporter ATP-binding protein n=1 Tax=Bacillus anthracis TaxID=1392 RepID=A0A2B0XCQ4_BACAN|nr:hypothetical protein COJ30_17785 [Bacillus anthracis]
MSSTLYLSSLPRYLRAVRPPPQNSAEAKKLGGRSTARKCPIGSTNNRRGMNTPH